MNERIRELLNEATSGLEPDLSIQRTVTLNEIQKFAELIVRECANQVDWILAEGGKTQGDLIKQHFGVKR
jgi:hypothetical protein